MIMNAISKGIENHKAEVAKREAERAAYLAAKSKYLDELNAAYRTIQPIIDRGLKNRYINRTDLAYHYAPELRSKIEELERIKRQQLLDQLRNN